MYLFIHALSIYINIKYEQGNYFLYIMKQIKNLASYDL